MDTMAMSIRTRPRLFQTETICCIYRVMFDSIGVTFVEKDGSERSIRAPLGKDLLTLAHSHDIDLEGHSHSLLSRSCLTLMKVPVKDHWLALPVTSSLRSVWSIVSSLPTQYRTVLDRIKSIMIGCPRQRTMRTICWILRLV